MAMNPYLLNSYLSQPSNGYTNLGNGSPLMGLGIQQLTNPFVNMSSYMPQGGTYNPMAQLLQYGTSPNGASSQSSQGNNLYSQKGINNYGMPSMSPQNNRNNPMAQMNAPKQNAGWGTGEVYKLNNGY